MLPFICKLALVKSPEQIKHRLMRKVQLLICEQWRETLQGFKSSECVLISLWADDI